MRSAARRTLPVSAAAGRYERQRLQRPEPKLYAYSWRSQTAPTIQPIRRAAALLIIC